MAKNSRTKVTETVDNVRSTAHKIALDLNNVQRNYMARAAGCARFAHNWALARYNELYEAWKLNNLLPKPNWMSLCREFNAIKRDKFPWMLEVTKCAPEAAIKDLGIAFDRFYKKVSKYPKFHKKGVRDSFYISNSEFAIKGKLIRVPKLGWVRMREELRHPNCKIMSATVSRTADRWSVSISIETNDPLTVTENQGTVGVDLGIRCLATLSNGKRYANPRPLARHLGLLKRLSRQLSRKAEGSNKKNRQRAKMRIARLHARIANVRKDALHKLTTDLTRNYGTVVIEHLEVSEMQKVPYMARLICDVGFYEFRRMLEYKAGWRSVKVIVADKGFPSSKLCSSCGYLHKEIKLSQRKWKCPKCGKFHDRDLNAAINLEKYAGRFSAAACGGLER
jgi:putative transposase